MGQNLSRLWVLLLYVAPVQKENGAILSSFLFTYYLVIAVTNKSNALVGNDQQKHYLNHLN